MKNILVIIPGVGDPYFPVKKDILTKNINIIKKTFSGNIDFKIFNYSDNTFPAEIPVIKEKGIIGEYLYKYITPSLVKDYNYILVLLDDIELVEGYNIDNMIFMLEELSLDIISPSLTSNSKYTWEFMLENNNYKNKLRIVNFCECFCYLMSQESYIKYYSLLDKETYWLWGIDMVLYNMGFKMGIYNEYKINHHFKSESYYPHLPNPFEEMEKKYKKFPKIYSYENLDFIEIV
jgi:hypothetical protein